MSRIIILGLAAILMLNCQGPIEPKRISISQPAAVKNAVPAVTGALKLKKLYTPTELMAKSMPFIGVEDAYALESTDQLLNGRYDRNFKMGDLEFSTLDLKRVQQILQSWQFTQPFGIENSIEAYQIKGAGGSGDVRFTAYYTPEFTVRTKKDGKYQYPVTVAYRSKPGDKNGSKRHEIAIKTFYTDNKKAVASMRMQGSGYLVFTKNRKVLVKFVGNPDKYIRDRSFARLTADDKLVNEKPRSYNQDRNFFLASPSSAPNGACKTSLIPFRSIAVDPKYIPLGSILLAEVPYRGPGGDVLYEKQLLYAQDTGGGIKGSSHVDLYYGAGAYAANRAIDIHHPGKLYLLLPKSDKTLIKP